MTDPITRHHVEAHRAGKLLFIIEPSWLRGFDHDVVFWEDGYPIQHCHVIGVPQGADPMQYATGLIESRGDMLLTQIRDIHAAAAAQNGAL